MSKILCRLASRKRPLSSPLMCSGLFPFDRGAAYIIRSAEGARFTIKGSREGLSGEIREAIKKGQRG